MNHHSGSMSTDRDLEKVDVPKADTASDITDPDAGLSPEERDKIVSENASDIEWKTLTK